MRLCCCKHRQQNDLAFEGKDLSLSGCSYPYSNQICELYIHLLIGLLSSLFCIVFISTSTRDPSNSGMIFCTCVLLYHQTISQCKKEGNRESTSSSKQRTNWLYGSSYSPSYSKQMKGRGNLGDFIGWKTAHKYTMVHSVHFHLATSSKTT